MLPHAENFQNASNLSENKRLSRNIRGRRAHWLTLCALLNLAVDADAA